MQKDEKEVVIKRKFRFSRLILLLLIMYILGYYTYRIVISPINNIYIEGNNILTDQEVIDISEISNYPSFLLTTRFEIKNNLLKNDLIKEVSVKKKLGRVVSISIVENEVLFLYNENVILSDGKQIKNKNYDLPYLEGELDENILNKLIEKYKNVNNEIKFMISEIKYDPNDIDKERFLLTMNDGNYVYVTLYKLSSINEYIKIVSKVEGKKGILYLDSGNYFETFK